MTDRPEVYFKLTEEQARRMTADLRARFFVDAEAVRRETLLAAAADALANCTCTSGDDLHCDHWSGWLRDRATACAHRRMVDVTLLSQRPRRFRCGDCGFEPTPTEDE